MISLLYARGADAQLQQAKNGFYLMSKSKI
jgi:hypothetical protein